MKREAGGGRGQFVRGFVVLLIGSVIGKAAGLLREVIFAAAFGSGSVATGFKSAQSAVLVSANLVTGDVLSSAFVPAYAAMRLEDRDRASRLLWAYLVGYGVVMSGIAGLVFLVRRPVMDALIPGAGPDVKLLAGDFLGTLAWCIPLFGVASIAGYALASEGRYTATSLRATLQTAGLLVGTLAAVLLGSAVWLAAGFVLAWVVYTAWCLLLLRRFELLRRSHLGDMRPVVRILLSNLYSVLPLAVIPAGIQIATVVQRIIASHGPSALIASVDYAQTLSDSLVTLVSVPLGFVGLTQLATVGEKDFLRTSRRILTSVVGFGLPLTFLVLPMTSTIVQVVYRRGSFDASAAALTTQVAFGLFCGITVQILGYALTRALSARRRNRAVLWITVTGLLVEIGVQSLSIVFGQPVFIGLGISAYGLVLTVLAAVQLGIHGRLLALVASGAPAMAASVLVLLLLPVPPLVQVVVVLVAWSANLLLAPPYRAALQDAVRLLRRSRGEQLPSTAPVATVSVSEQ